MRWMKEHGLISNLRDYVNLPQQVAEDARMLMESEARQMKRAQPERESRSRR